MSFRGRMSFVIVATDGETIRTLHPAAFGAQATALEAIVRAALVPPAPMIEARAVKPEPVVDATLTQAEIARQRGYTGDMCQNPACGAFAMKRAGTCLTCDVCASSFGGCD